MFYYYYLSSSCYSSTGSSIFYQADIFFLAHLLHPIVITDRKMERKMVYLVVVLLRFVVLLPWLFSDSESQPVGSGSEGIREVEALMGIKAALVDPQNALSSWEGNSVDPCNWNHVSCNNSITMITDLELPGLQLAGTLASSIGQLTNLKSLKLENNNLSGPIPEEMGNLSKLYNLDLSNNNFSSSIPVSLAQLKSLSYMQLNNNSFSGAVPIGLDQISSLYFVDLSYNNLSGRIPNFSAKTIKLFGNPFLCGSGSIVCPGEAEFAPSSSLGLRLHKSGVVAIAILVPAFVTLCLAALVWRWRRKQIHLDSIDQQDSPEICLGQVKRFTFRELQAATENFNPRNELGSGGFGVVYKGTLSDGSIIAVKRLKDRNAAGGEAQFRMEVEMISLALHRNLLRLIGYCGTAMERLLVYPYMPNGSVAYRLREKPALDWHIRKRIAVGSARGLAYLHEQCDPKIIHRDVKAANILLDEDYEAVVGDFGLAKLLDHTESHVTTAVRGTVGHIAPEYLSTGQSSDKTDVFGFGILLLELITGQRAIDFGQKFNQRGHALLDWAKKLLHEKRLCELVDDELKDNSYESVEQVVQVALLCTQLHPAERPKMSEVVRMLEGDGLLERWEASQASSETNHFGAEQLPQRYYDLAIDSTLVLDAVELSGPR